MKREFTSLLITPGFISREDKGSHRNFTHESGTKITMSGKTGDDAKPYQVKAVKKAIDEASK